MAKKIGNHSNGQNKGNDGVTLAGESVVVSKTSSNDGDAKSSEDTSN